MLEQKENETRLEYLARVMVEFADENNQPLEYQTEDNNQLLCNALELAKEMRQEINNLQNDVLQNVDRNGKQLKLGDTIQTFFDDGETKGHVGVLIKENDMVMLETEAGNRFPLFFYAYCELVEELE